MKRRDFLKAIGFGAACIALAGSDYIEKKPSSKGVKDEILDQIDDRIEKYRKGDMVLHLIGPEGATFKTGLNLNIEQTKHEFLFGSNIFNLGRCESPQANAAYADHFTEMLNYATLPFYWDRYESERGKPDDARTNEIVQWCRANNVTTKGHPLAWSYTVPKWLGKNPEQAMQLQLERIDRCIRRFKGDINIWDVVNEAAHYDSPHFREKAPILTEAIKKIGVGEYVRRAFKIARQANPSANLIVNDYLARRKYLDEDFQQKIISQLVDEDGRLLYDTVGIQSHMHKGYWGVEKTWDICELYAKSGKPLHFTELTILSGKLKEDGDWFSTREGWLTTDQGEKRQAQQTTELYRLLFSHPAVEAITWWDFSDYNAWQGAPAGLLGKDMTPKPVYEQLKNLIKNKWWTKSKATVAASGKISLRGFYGGYKVTAYSAGRELSGTFAFNKKTKQPIIVQLN